MTRKEQDLVVGGCLLIEEYYGTISMKNKNINIVARMSFDGLPIYIMAWSKCLFKGIVVHPNGYSETSYFTEFHEAKNVAIDLAKTKKIKRAFSNENR